MSISCEWFTKNKPPFFSSRERKEFSLYIYNITSYWETLSFAIVCVTVSHLEQSTSAQKFSLASQQKSFSLLLYFVLFQREHFFRLLRTLLFLFLLSFSQDNLILEEMLEETRDNCLRILRWVGRQISLLQIETTLNECLF